MAANHVSDGERASLVGDVAEIETRSACKLRCQKVRLRAGGRSTIAALRRVELQPIHQSLQRLCWHRRPHSHRQVECRDLRNWLKIGHWIVAELVVNMRVDAHHADRCEEQHSSVRWSVLDRQHADTAACPYLVLYDDRTSETC